MISKKRLYLMSAISIADVLTMTRLQLGPGAVKGLIIPVSANSGDTTISFYFRNDEQYQQNGYSTLMDVKGILNGSLLSSFDEGPIASQPQRFYSDGYDVSQYNANVIIANSAQTKWVRYDIRFVGTPRTAGNLYFFLNSNLTNNFQRWKIADFRIYDYAISIAQINQPLLPNDYVARYNFADYQVGNTSTADISGNGNDATLYF